MRGYYPRLMTGVTVIVVGIALLAGPQNVVGGFAFIAFGILYIAYVRLRWQK